MPSASVSTALLALTLLLSGCASAPAPAPPAPESRGPTHFPLFQGTVQRPVWLERAEVNEKGLPIVRGPTRANVETAVVPYTDLPLMELEPCEEACARFDIPVTRVEGGGVTARGPGGVVRMESSRTLPSPDGMNRAVEWWIVDRDPASWTLGVTRVVGLFHPGDRTPIGYVRGHVEAAPIEGEVLFAFRTCDEGCDRFVGDPRRVEGVTLVGPGRAWTSSSDDPRQETREEGFTHVTAHVHTGAAESVTLNYDAADASRFKDRPTGPILVGGITTVMLDVVWPEGEMPELSIHRGFFADAREAPDLRLPITTAR